MSSGSLPSPPRRPGSALAIDHGTKRSGFAVADALGISTRALPVCEHGDAEPAGSEALRAHVAALLAERDVRVLILGLPTNMDGSEGPRARAVRSFGASLEARFPQCQVVYQDERLSTKEAEELLREAQVPVRERRAWKDSFSALVILRDWLREGAG